MATGYARQSAGVIVTGNVIQASHSNNEFNALLAAMNASTGHNHDGSAGGGAKIPLTTGVSDILSLANGGTGGALTDPNADRLFFWDDSAGATAFLTPSSNFVITGTSLELKAGLASLGGLTTGVNKGIYTSALDVFATYDLSAYARTILDDADAATARSTLGLGSVATLSSVAYANIQNVSATDRLLGRSTAGAGVIEEITCTSFARSVLDDADAPTARNTLGFRETIMVAISDETTAITTGTAKITFRMPYAFTLTAVRASLTTESSSGIPTFDINENGTTILSTKLTIDAGEKTSTTAATAVVISDSSLADDAEITIDVDVAGTGAIGAKIYLIGYKTA